MRLPGGLSRRRYANVDAVPQAQPRVDWECDPVYEGAVDNVRELDLVARQMAPSTLEGRAYGIENRLATMELAFTLRPEAHALAAPWTGMHGMVVDRRGDIAQQAGGMQPWDAQRRTLRSQPTVPWDAGTAIGSAA